MRQYTDLIGREPNGAEFATKILKFGEKTAAKYADELIVLSEGTRDYFKETYGRETVFIPNGIDVQNEKKADIITKKYGLEKDGYILFLARIVPEKGLHYLIDAFMQTDTDKKLVIAGGVSHSGEYAKQIHDMAKDDRIIFTGFVEALINLTEFACLPNNSVIVKYLTYFINKFGRRV